MFYQWAVAEGLAGAVPFTYALGCRTKRSPKSVPFQTLKTLPDGSELVVLHESNGMLGKSRRDAGDKTAPRLPDTIARLVQFTLTTRTRSGRVKTSIIRVLTTLLDHAAFPAAEIAALYAERWQVPTGRIRLMARHAVSSRGLRNNHPLDGLASPRPLRPGW